MLMIRAGAEKKFKEVRKAYDVISNPQKRSAYDQFGHAGVEQGAGGFGGGNPFGGVQAVLETYLEISLVVEMPNQIIEVPIYAMI